MTHAILAYNNCTIKERGEMLSLTDMWRAAEGTDSQRPSKWLTIDATKQFVEYLSTTVPVADSELIQALNEGGEWNTWAHWQIGLAYAKYLSPSFHAWCNSVVRDRMLGRTMPNFADPVAAARAWADAYEAQQIAQQQVKLLEEQREADRPYTEIAKAITGESTMIIRDWISMMKDEYGGHIKEKKVREFLHDSGYWYWTQTSPRETRAYAQFDHLFKLETELCSGMPRLLLKITGRGVFELTPIVVRHFEK